MFFVLYFVYRWQGAPESSEHESYSQEHLQKPWCQRIIHWSPASNIQSGARLRHHDSNIRIRETILPDV